MEWSHSEEANTYSASQDFPFILCKSTDLCHKSPTESTVFTKAWHRSLLLFSTVQQPLVGHSLLIVEALRSHLDTPHSVGLLWTSNHPDAETSTWQHTTLKETDIHAPGGIRTLNPSKRAAADPRLRTCGHWDRQSLFLATRKHSTMSHHTSLTQICTIHQLL
jgi:hypothetical protein